MEALDSFGFEVLTLQHGLEFVLDLSFGISGQLETDRKTLHVVFLNLIIAIFVFMDIVFFAHAVTCVVFIVCDALLMGLIWYLFSGTGFKYSEL